MLSWGEFYAILGRGGCYLKVDFMLWYLLGWVLCYGKRGGGNGSERYWASGTPTYPREAWKRPFTSNHGCAVLRYFFKTQSKVVAQ